MSDDTYDGSISIYASYVPGLGGGGGEPGRRVFMPWGGAWFGFSSLSSDGLDLLAEALEWAGQAGGSGAYSYTLVWQE